MEPQPAEHIAQFFAYGHLPPWRDYLAVAWEVAVHVAIFVAFAAAGFFSHRAISGR